MKYLILLAFSFFAGCYAKTAIKTGLEGKPVPSFDLILPDSTSYLNTRNSLTGRPVVLFYFGPHCPYSRTQMNDIILNIAALKNIQFYIFTNWPFKDMKEFYNNYQLNRYPNITTGQDFKNYFTNYFNAQGVPYIAVYGKDKLLNKVFVGKTDIEQIRQGAEE